MAAQKPDGRELGRLLREKKRRAQACPVIKGELPALSPLTLRIAEWEKASGHRWNGKIYGGPGSRRIYIDGKAYEVDDDAVLQREENLRAIERWLLDPKANQKKKKRPKS